MRGLMRGLGSLVALLALVGGIPFALGVFGGRYLPDHVPDWSEITSVLSRPDTGSLFFGLLTIVAWIAWAIFTLSVVVEIPAQLSRAPAVRLPGFGGGQRLAGVLVAGVIALMSASPIGVGSASAGPIVPAASVSVSAAAELPAPVAVQQVSEENTPVPATGWSYAVQRGDTLWGLAERYLGDGELFGQILDPNVGVPQPDGRALGRDGMIDVGWVLQIPGQAPPDATHQAGVHPVAAGDTLGEIAARYLGDEMRWPEIYDLNVGVVQADGSALTDPDMIDVGWVLQIPGPGATAPQPEPAPAPVPPVEEAPAPAPAPEPAPVPEPAPAPAPAPGEGAGDDLPIKHEQTSTSAAQGDPSSASDTGDVDDEAPVGQIVAGIGGLLAAGILSWLGGRRLLARRRRKPGRRATAPPPSMSDLELTLRCAEEPGDVETLDRALRSLSVALARSGRNLPDLITARLDAAGLCLEVAEGEGAPAAPFIADPSDPTLWRLAAEHPGMLSAEEAASVPAPYPALVSLGQTATGDLILIDLETAAAVSLSGSRPSVQAVLTAMAAELALAGWADYLQVGLVGVAPELPAALETDRLRVAASVDEVLDRLEERSREIAIALEGEAGSVAEARTRQVAGDAWSPQILLTADPLTHEQQQRLARLVDVAPHSALAAVVAVVEDTETALPGPWHVRVPDGRDEFTVLSQVDERLRLQRLTAVDYQALLEDLREAVVPVDEVIDDLVPDEPSVPLPPLPEEELVLKLSPADPSRAVSDSEDPDPDPEPEPDPPGGIDADDSTAALPPWVAATFDDPAGVPTFDDDAVADERELAPVGLRELPVPGPEVRMLGPVEIVGLDNETAGEKKFVELTAFLVLNPGCTGEQVSVAMGDLGKPWTANTRHPVMSRLRDWLGKTAGGERHLPVAVGGRHRLAETVRSDWARFCELKDRGLARGRPAGMADLTRALGMVRGAPFADAKYPRYVWADHVRAEMIDAIVDVAHTLAVWYTEAGSIGEARRAISVGLQAEPGSEALLRDLMRAEHRAGNRAGVLDAANRVTAINHAIDTEPEPETEDLIDALLRPQRTHFDRVSAGEGRG